MPSTMICSGVRTCGSEASAPSIGSCVSRFRPTGDQWAPVATTTISAPYARTPSASRRRPVSVSTFASFPSWMVRQFKIRPHSPRPGSCGIQRVMPPISGSASTRWTRPKPRLPSTIAHSIPAGPAPTTSTSRSRFSAGSKRSGCQPRRNSSPAVAFWVQPMLPPGSAFGMQILQPMHSRISSRRPSSTFSGRNGSAIDGRAAPITSQAPLATISAIRSGSVMRETPTIGFAVASRTRPVHSSCQPCLKKREAPESFDHSVADPIATSQRSTRWSASATNSSASSSSTP